MPKQEQAETVRGVPQKNSSNSNTESTVSVWVLPHRIESASLPLNPAFPPRRSGAAAYIDEVCLMENCPYSSLKIWIIIAGRSDLGKTRRRRILEQNGLYIFLSSASTTSAKAFLPSIYSSPLTSRLSSSETLRREEISSP